MGFKEKIQQDFIKEIKDINNISDLALFDSKYNKIHDGIFGNNINKIIDIFDSKINSISKKIDKIIINEISNFNKSDDVLSKMALYRKSYYNNYLKIKKFVEYQNSLIDIKNDIQDLVLIKTYRKNIASEVDINNITAYYLKNIYSFEKGIKWKIIKLDKTITEKKGEEEFRIDGVIKIGKDIITIFDNKIYDIIDGKIIGESNKYELYGFKISKKLIKGDKELKLVKEIEYIIKDFGNDINENQKEEIIELFLTMYDIDLFTNNEDKSKQFIDKLTRIIGDEGKALSISRDIFDTLWMINNDIF